MSRRTSYKDTITQSNLVTTDNSTPFSTKRCKILGIQIALDVNTPSAATFLDAGVNTTTDVITTQSAHGFATTGLKVAATTSGTLPGGLSATDYYVIVVSSTTLKLATSLANAQAGTAVDITSAAGGGTHTLTPASLAGGTVALQKSNDYDPVQNPTGTWASGTSASFTADGTAWIEDVDPEYAYARVQISLTAGRVSAVSTVTLKEDY